MLARLEIQLECKEKLNYQMSSLFQGVLMENIRTTYAEQLHESKLHPYTQHLEYRDKNWYWIVTTLNQEAEREIIQQGLLPLNKIQLKKKEWDIKFVKKTYQTESYENLTRQFYEQESSYYISLQFVTPTAFRSYGEYIYYPSPKLIFQSLMNRYDAIAEEEGMRDEETLNQLSSQSKIIRYELRSVLFHLEGVKVPSFIGKITIKMSGSQTMARFAHMLLQFGTYSGVGIKTAIGMGAIQLLDEGREKGDRKSDEAHNRQSFT